MQDAPPVIVTDAPPIITSRRGWFRRNGLSVALSLWAALVIALLVAFVVSGGLWLVLYFILRLRF
jgi:hypothetical protein